MPFPYWGKNTGVLGDGTLPAVNTQHCSLTGTHRVVPGHTAACPQEWPQDPVGGGGGWAANSPSDLMLLTFKYVAIF